MLRDVCVDISQAVSVGDFVPSFLINKIAPGVNQWNVQLKDLVSYLYVCSCAEVLLSSELIPRSTFMWALSCTVSPYFCQIFNLAAIYTNLCTAEDS